MILFINRWLFTLSLHVFNILLYLTLVDGQSGNDVKDVITKLFTTDSYNKNVRPLTDQTQPVIVYMNYFLNSIIEFDETDESITTSGYLTFEWNDEYLTWNDATYNGVNSIFLPQDNIWKPDISLRNSFKTFTGLGSSYLNVKVDNTGTVIWQPFQVLKSTCSLDITYFPFDTQTCYLKFTAWSYIKDELELNIGPRGIELEDYAANSGWALISTSGHEVNSDEAAVIFTVKLQRKPLFFLLNIIAPVVMLTFLNIATFLLPVNSGERASYAITVFLSLAVFLTIVASLLPKNSDVVSLLGVYLIVMTVLSTLIVFVSLLETRIAVRDEEKHLINMFYKALYKSTRVIRCLTCKAMAHNNIPVNKHNKVKPNSKPSIQCVDADLKWNDIVSAIDFVVFWFALLFTFGVTTTVFCVARYYGNLEKQ